jgi:hypothetical protein
MLKPPVEEATMRTSRTVRRDDQEGSRRPPTRAPIQYVILWAIIADRELIASTKIVATAMLLKFRNNETANATRVTGAPQASLV